MLPLHLSSKKTIIFANKTFARVYVQVLLMSFIDFKVIPCHSRT